MICFADAYLSPLGTITLLSSECALTGLWFEGQKTHPVPGSACCRKTKPIAMARAWLDIYFSGGIPGFTPPIEPAGTPFQRAVWQHLMVISYGHTVTYGQIAALMPVPSSSGVMSPQAVGRAVGSNPISLIVPCHRVIGANGRLTGYAGGLDKKAFLLALEARVRERV